MAAELEVVNHDSDSYSGEPGEPGEPGGSAGSAASLVVVRKVATNDDEHQRFANEALMLQRAAHPGVVEFLSFDEASGTLRTQFVGDQTWQSAPPETISDLAKGIATIASTLHDLHTLAITHGSLHADHIILGPNGRPVLCDLSMAGDQDPSSDIEALGRLLAGCLEKLEVRGDERSAARKALSSLAKRATLADPSKRPSASAVATAASQLVDSPQKANNRKLQPSRSMVVGVAALLAALAVLFWPSGDQPLAIATLDDAIPVAAGPTVAPASTAPLPTPPTTNELIPEGPLVGDPLIIEHSGFRYAVGQVGDSAAVGDWDCDGAPTAAVLRPHSGQVYLFDDWPDDDATAAVTPLTIPNSTARLDASTTCGLLILVDAAGQTVTLDVEQTANGATS